jgi:hypothetical protein
MNNWRKESEAPKDGTWILGWRPSHNQYIIVRWSSIYGWNAPFAENIKISHWTDVPKPPEITGGQK